MPLEHAINNELKITAVFELQAVYSLTRWAVTAGLKLEHSTGKGEQKDVKSEKTRKRQKDKREATKGEKRDATCHSECKT